MPEGEDYPWGDMQLPFVTAFVGHATVIAWGTPMTIVHTKYLDLVLKLIKDWDDKDMNSEKKLKVFEDIIRLKELTNNTFKSHCEIERFTLKVYLGITW